MKNNKNIIAAAVLAAVLGLAGCNTDNERSNAFSYDDYSSVSSVSTVSEPVTPNASNTESTLDTSSTQTDESTSFSQSEISYPDSNSGSGTDDSAAASTQSETKYPDIVCTVDWNDDNSKYDDDKSIGFKSPSTEAEKLVDALIDELDLNNNKKTDMEKLCILGKWFSDNTEYDYELVGTADAIYNAGKAFSTEDEVNYLLTKHGGKCSSYAKAACLILSKCGIDTLYCKNVNINHAWNAVKIDGQWTYTDFVGGPDTLILGSSRHGLPKNTVIDWCTTFNGYGYGGAKPDISEISSDLRLFDFDGKELEVHEEADGYSYVDSSGQGGKVIF
ncbi:MAG: hypothetical protein K2N38_05070 [Oscillospiraceae bacterium]|nr:hypothetical protein [Oscillospiraceae bacterium]